MQRSFDINVDELINATAKLEKLNRSALPVAVRQTLNDTAFLTKKMLPKEASKKFTTRQKNFFNAFSTVQKAQGWDVNKMEAIVGIDTKKGSRVAAGLEAQETGGVIAGRKLVPHDMGRISGSYGKSLQKKHLFKKIRIHDATSAYKYGSNRGRKSKFAAAAFSASKRGTDYFLLKKGNRGTVFKLESPLSSSLKRKTLKLRFKPVYSYRGTKTHKVDPSPFMKPSATYAIKKIPEIYIKNAEYQFKRALAR
ncbi:hypothetical protein [Cytophaga sp. FL35]|uniref:hypothetical protein n=1 Tax=Cytophaga sp. FL35 TaxID=1904456 RepID=UPI001653D49D|nr:hypothetical protein [Cytophaga sp. FL35]MBC6999684.1 hypothetical protein [Cytophaga sp. FL35]